MIKLPKPTIPVEEVYTACISNRRDREDLEPLLPDIIHAEQEFETKANNNSLHTITTSDNVQGIPSKEMKKIYENKMVKKEQPGRKYYDKIFLSAPNNICPLCGQNQVKTLDHHLPKAHYPKLVVTPINLVPACRDCNMDKNAPIPTSACEETLHPYFDDFDYIGSEQWLFATLKSFTPITVEFEIKIPRGWDEVLGKRIEKHFEAFELASLYSVHSATELSSINNYINNLFAAGGSLEVKAHLKEQFEGKYQDNKNSWRTALYKALYESSEYCEGVFSL